MSDEFGRRKEESRLFLRACIAWGALLLIAMFLMSAFTSAARVEGAAAGVLYMIVTVWFYTRTIGGHDDARPLPSPVLLTLAVIVKFSVLAGLLYVLAAAGAAELVSFLLGVGIIFPAALQTASRAR